MSGQLFCYCSSSLASEGDAISKGCSRCDFIMLAGLSNASRVLGPKDECKSVRVWRLRVEYESVGVGWVACE